MVVTYSEQLAESIARDIRAILQAEWFKEVFETRIAKDHSAVMDFGTTAGGQLYAASFSGSITGRGADLIIIDDPHDIKDAGSPDQLERTADIFNTIVMSRLNNRKSGKVVVIAHRIHDNDLSARLLRQGNWRHLALPMVAIADTEYETNYGRWRRRKGELLRPGAYGPDDLEELRANTHNPGFELLYQQDVDGLALPSIRAENFPIFLFAPSEKTPCVMSIDSNMKAGSRNSFSVIQVWRPWNGAHYLIDQWRGQCSYAELYSKAKTMIVRRQPAAILIEESANGHALASSLRPRYGALIRPIRPQGSKRSRLLRHVDTILAGRIRLPGNEPWREDFVAESVAFPYSDVFKRRLRAMGIRDKPTAPRSPRQNGHCERLIGSIRRECLDHVVVLGERHPRHVLLSYLGYYNRARTHLALCKDAPISRATQSAGTIRSTPILGGLHHQYGRI